VSTDIWTNQYEADLDEEVATQVTFSGIPTSGWAVSGRVSKDKPNKEDLIFWREEGARQVQAYVEWLDKSGWVIAVLPDGRKAIEVALEIQIGGVPIKLVIDAIYDTGNGVLMIVDYKTGSRTPISGLQLGLYATALEKAYGIRIQLGAYYMTRKGILSDPVNLDKYTEGVLSSLYQQLDTAIRDEIFIPNPGTHCVSCGVREACYLMGGGESAKYDPLDPEYRKGSDVQH
jgi:CRISPR/Cas system-associated exonuclease Cas4 (RecB family)